MHYRGVDPAVRDVRIALSRDSIAWLPIYVAQSLGYYQDEGLTISISDVAGLSKGMEALLGGSVDVAGFDGDTLLVQVAAEGRPVRTFLSFYTRPSLALVVAPQAGVGDSVRYPTSRADMSACPLSDRRGHLMVNSCAHLEWCRRQTR